MPQRGANGSQDGEVAAASPRLDILPPRCRIGAGRHVGMWPNKAEVTGPNGGPIPVMAATVVLPIEAMNPEQREALRSALLLAKAKERAMSQAQQVEEEE